MESTRAKIVIFYYESLIVDESEALNFMRTWQRVESIGLKNFKVKIDEDS